MEILVTGGTGFVGRALCRELAERGHEVTALARTPEDAAVPDGVATVAGDVTDAESLDPHVEGRDAVVNLVALSPLYQPKGGDEMHFRVHTDGTENCVEAAERHGVDRFLQMSALSASPDAPTASLRAKGEAEALVRDAELDWTILRPSVIFGEGGEFVEFTKKLKRMFAPGLPVYPLPGGGTMRFQPIWIGDIVPMMADALEDDDHAGETYEVGGPDVLSLREIVDLVYEAEGRSVQVVPLPMALARVGLTVGGAVPGFPMGADQYRSLRIDNVADHNDVDAFGVATSDLERLRTYLGLD
jgi:NADH dehydrogenase